MIHELNHLIELFLIKNNKDSNGNFCSSDFISGFDMVKNDNSTEKDEEKNKRKYELFNEVINNILAKEITKLMHEKGIYIFNKEESAKIDGNSIQYESLEPVVMEFYNVFRSEIIETRQTGNIQLLLNIIGNQNFSDLNELVKQYDEVFSTRMTGIDEVYEEKIKEIINRSKQVVQSMIQYKEKHYSSVGNDTR